MTANDPRFAEPITRSAELELVNDSRHVWRIFEEHPETGEPIVMVEITYERQPD